MSEAPHDLLGSSPSLSDDLDSEIARAKVYTQLFGNRLQPTRVGRYVILGRIGSGAAGLVYSAFDPELDRKLAIKLVRARLGAGEDPRAAQTRLLREAQTAARLSHHNVVHVYDVGTLGDDDVFMAMEYVDGSSLRAWLADEPRSVAAILDVLLQAGRGLQAAHAAGLTHRDFKPDNVLVDRAGRAYVADFGLARPPRSVVATTASVASSTSDVTASLGDPGAGTPAYMAPEQFERAPIDPRADQFAFCVTLWEALAGARPFAGSTVAELAVATAAGELRTIGRGKIPARVRSVLERGLSPHPADRHPDMNSLLSALQPRRGRAGVVIPLVAAIAVVASVAAWSASRAEPCPDMTDRLAGVWDDARHHEVATAFAATEAPFAPQAQLAVVAGLDEYGADWVQQRQEACIATKIHGEQSEAALDARMQCLDRRRSELAAIVDVFADADREVVAGAARAVSRLGSLSICRDVPALLAVVPPPDPDTAERVTALRAELDRARAKHAAGAYADAIEIGRALLPAARELGYRPLLAEVELQHADALVAIGDDAQVAELYEEGVRHADAARDDRMRVVGLVAHAIWLAGQANDAAAALQIVARVEGPLDRIGRPRELEAEVVNAHAAALLQNGDARPALPLFERALALAEGDDHLRGAILNNIAFAHSDLDAHDLACETLERAVELRAAVYGRQHPMYADNLANLGVVLFEAGRWEDARRVDEEALQVLEVAYEGPHRDTVRVLGNLANVYSMLGRHGQADATSERAIAMGEQVIGADSVEVGRILLAAGSRYERLGRSADARRVYERAYAIMSRALPADHQLVGFAEEGLASSLVDSDPERALVHYRHALEVIETRVGPDHRDVAITLGNLGSTLVRVGRADEALVHLRRAVEIQERAGGPPKSVAYAHLGLGKASWAVGERDEGRRLAQQAREEFVTAGPAFAGLVQEVDEWLAAH